MAASVEARQSSPQAVGCFWTVNTSPVAVSALWRLWKQPSRGSMQSGIELQHCCTAACAWMLQLPASACAAVGSKEGSSHSYPFSSEGHSRPSLIVALDFE